MVGKGITVMRARGTSDRACLRKPRVVNPEPRDAVYPKEVFISRKHFAEKRRAQAGEPPLRSGRDVGGNSRHGTCAGTNVPSQRMAPPLSAAGIEKGLTAR